MRKKLTVKKTFIFSCAYTKTKQTKNKVQYNNSDQCSSSELKF